jgi:hypothetical protein
MSVSRSWSDIGCLITPPRAARARRREWSDQPLLAIGLELVAQSPGVKLDRITLDHGVAPDALEDLLTQEHLARMTREQQRLVLAGGQIE